MSLIVAYVSYPLLANNSVVSKPMPLELPVIREIFFNVLLLIKQLLMDYPEALVNYETIMSFNSINIPEVEQVVFLVESLIIISNAYHTPLIIV
jgi:hypothetical protein